MWFCKTWKPKKGQKDSKDGRMESRPIWQALSYDMHGWEQPMVQVNESQAQVWQRFAFLFIQSFPSPYKLGGLFARGTTLWMMSQAC